MHYLNAESHSQSDGELVPKSSISYASKPGKYSYFCCTYRDLNDSLLINCYLITFYCYFILNNLLPWPYFQKLIQQLKAPKTGQKYTGPMENVVVSDLGDDVSGTLAEQVKSHSEKQKNNNLQKNNVPVE